MTTFTPPMLAFALVAVTGGDAGHSCDAWSGAVRIVQAESPQGGTGYDPMAPPDRGGQSDEAEDVELNPEFDNLPDTAGVEDTYSLCSGCHSVAIIKQQRVSDERWDYLWGWMIEEQGMPEVEPEMKEEILSYLKQHFSSER